MLTNRSAICTICHTANEAYVSVIEACHKMVFVLSQLTCINTYIKYLTEKSHKKRVNYVKSTLVRFHRRCRTIYWVLKTVE